MNKTVLEAIYKSIDQESLYNIKKQKELKIKKKHKNSICKSMFYMMHCITYYHVYLSDPDN